MVHAATEHLPFRNGFRWGKRDARQPSETTFEVPSRLAEARTHAERALGIKAALDLATAEIWKIYSVLADIAAKQGDADAARFYGEKARASYAALTGAGDLVGRQGPLIAAVVEAICDPSARPALDPVLVDLAKSGSTELVGAVRRMLDGERREDVLVVGLDNGDTLLIRAILAELNHPQTRPTQHHVREQRTFDDAEMRSSGERSGKLTEI